MRIIDKILGVFGIRGGNQARYLTRYGIRLTSIGRYGIPGMMRRTGMSMSVSGRR